MNLCIDEALKSEVEKRKNEVVVGMSIIYSDSSNFEKYEVISVEDDYFVAKDSMGNEKEYFFDELQIGWKFN